MAKHTQRDAIIKVTKNIQMRSDLLQTRLVWLDEGLLKKLRFFD